MKARAYSLEKRVKILRLHILITGTNLDKNMDNPPTFKKPRLRESYPMNDNNVNENVPYLSIETPSGSSTLESWSSINKNLLKMYNVQCREEADDAIAEIFMPMGLHLSHLFSLFQRNGEENQSGRPRYIPKVTMLNEIRATLLDRVSRMQGLMEDLKLCWVLSRSSTIMKGWTYIL